MSQMLKSSGALAAATMMSRILGMVREMVYAGFMEVSWVASAFFLAFQVPNLFRRLLGEGALTAAFIPIFKRKEREEGEVEMWRAANVVISGLVTGAGVICIVAVIGITIALNVHTFNPQATLMLRLLRLMFPYMVLVCLAAVLIGMANARGHFFVPAMGAVMLNVIMIGSVLVARSRLFPRHVLEEQIFVVAIGVVIAGVAQAFFQVPSLSSEGFRYRWISPWKDPTMREVVRQMLPGSVGVAAFQINVLATQSFSFWFDPSIVSSFNYSVRLMELPQGIFGISLATYLLPTLAGLAADKKFPEFRQTLSQGLCYLSFANLIAAAMAFSLALPIVRLLFEHGKFGPDATHRVATALACLAPGLLMFSMNNILARAFYALGDVKTPMKISVLCLCLNLVFAIWLVQRYREAGLGVANTMSGCFNTGLLIFALRKKLSRLGLQALKQTLLVLVPSAAFAGFLAYWIFGWWDRSYGHLGLVQRLGGVFIPMTIAGVVYWTIGLLARVPAAREILAFVRRRTSQ